MAKISSALAVGASLVFLILGSHGDARADAIPYPNPGTINSATYTFTAATSGDVIAYFAGGRNAGYDNKVGLLINGVDHGIYGLDNHHSNIGDQFDFGPANAGDVLTFVLQSNDGSSINTIYSDPSLNLAYDGSAGHQHVYATPYSATSPIPAGFDSIPAGLFVAFEDQRFPSSDFNYNDEDFVVPNVNVSVPGPVVGAGLPGLMMAGSGFIALMRRRRQHAA